MRDLRGFEETRGCHGGGGGKLVNKNVSNAGNRVEWPALLSKRKAAGYENTRLCIVSPNLDKKVRAYPDLRAEETRNFQTLMITRFIYPFNQYRDCKREIFISVHARYIYLEYELAGNIEIKI